jgi:hypothetical protein
MTREGLVLTSGGDWLLAIGYIGYSLRDCIAPARFLFWFPNHGETRR